MATWTPDSGDSPDNMDALVWALTELSALGERKKAKAGSVNIGKLGL